MAVLIADAVMLPLTYRLASMDIHSWWTVAPMFAVNLPALPLAVLFAVLGEDLKGAGPVSSAILFVAMNASLVIASSWGWGRFATAVRDWRDTR